MRLYFVNGQRSAIETHQCVFNFIGIIDTSFHLGICFLRRINVCLILLESLIRLYIGGMVKINHRLSNLRRFVQYNLFLRCILLGFLLFYREIYLARQMLCCICWRNS